MNTKYLIGDIKNYHYLDGNFKGFYSDSLKLERNKINNLKKYRKEGLDFDFEVTSNQIQFLNIIINPITVQKYETTEMYVLNEGTIFSVIENSYAKETGMTLIVYDNIEYVASLDEIQYFSIPIAKIKDDIYCPFKLMEQKKGFWDEKLNIIFHTLDIAKEYHRKFIPLIGILKQFIELQDDYIFPYFLSNILNILTEAKNMLASDIYEKDKEELWNETIIVIEKLKKSIHDVSPFQYEKVKKLEDCISEYYDKEKIQTQKEMEEKRRLEESKNEKRELFRKSYLNNIKAKSELLDYFNSNMQEISN